MQVTLTPKQAAVRANVSRSLIYSLLRQGKLPAARIGCRGRGKWLISPEDLETYMEQCKVTREPLTPLRHIK